nr:energy transducer TonB [Sulfitobacter algicola]
MITWAIFGGEFRSDPLPFEDVQVTTISGEEFAALTAQSIAPNVVTNVEVPVAPEVAETPELVVPEDEPEQSEVAQAPPLEVPDAPEIDVSTPAPPPEPDPPVNETDPADEVGQEAVDVVAPVPTEAPEPDVETADTTQEAVEPTDEGETVVEEVEATAPPEAGTEIVTEAEETPGAPARSIRPQARPDRLQTAQAEPEQEAEPETPATEVTETIDTSDAVAEALGAALGDTPSGPPLTPGETEGFRLAVGECWNIGALGTDSLNVIVVVGFSMDLNAKPVSSSIRLISSSGGTDDAVNRSYESARRAILRCGTSGYNLPADKYDHWKEIEITFDPTKMGIR